MIGLWLLLTRLQRQFRRSLLRLSVQRIRCVIHLLPLEGRANDILAIGQLGRIGTVHGLVHIRVLLVLLLLLNLLLLLLIGLCQSGRIRGLEIRVRLEGLRRLPGLTTMLHLLRGRWSVLLRLDCIHSHWTTCFRVESTIVTVRYIDIGQGAATFLEMFQEISL